MVEELPYMIYLVLFQNSLMFFLNTLTFVLISQTLYSKLRTLKQSEISPQFLVYLFAVAAMAFFGLIKSGYVVCVWGTKENDAFIIYTTTTAVLMILPIVSLAVSYLILHRTLIITRFMAQTNIHQWFLNFSIASMFVLIGISIAYYIWIWSLVVQPAPTDCWTINCVTGFNGTNVSLWGKLITGFLNALIGIWFFYELQKSQKQVHASQQPNEQLNKKKKANKLALLTIIIEIVLNFLPAFIDLILRSTVNFSLTNYVGVYTTFFGSLDGLFVAFVYFNGTEKLKTIISKVFSTHNL